MTPKTIVEITWADTHSGGTGWTPISEIDQDEYIIKSCGYLLAVGDGGKENHVTLYQSRTEDDDLDHVLHIPVAMIRKIKSVTPLI
jgi:hypothetical protein